MINTKKSINNNNNNKIRILYYDSNQYITFNLI